MDWLAIISNSRGSCVPEIESHYHSKICFLPAIEMILTRGLQISVGHDCSSASHQLGDYVWHISIFQKRAQREAHQNGTKSATSIAARFSDLGNCVVYCSWF